MTYEQIISDLKNKIYRPVYFLSGEEPYYIDIISDYIEANVLTDSEKSFNQTVLYGKDTPVSHIITLARRYPMMANYQVIILKEAQEMDKFEDLEVYFSNPLKSTILVICYKYKKPDLRKKIFKIIAEKGISFDSKKLYDNQVPVWIEKAAKSKGYSIESKASMLLSEYLGNNLSKIINEINKLTIVIPENNKHISSDLIEKYIGISKEYNIFELQNALGKKDALKAYKIAGYFGRNEKANPLVYIITMLFSFYSKLLLYYYFPGKPDKELASLLKVTPFYIKDYINAAKRYTPAKLVQIISILKEYDLKSKGINNSGLTPEGELLKEMISKIIN